MNSHEKIAAVGKILKAQESIEDARILLIEAAQLVSHSELKHRIDLRYKVLYADAIPTYCGGDGKFFDSFDLVKEIMNL